MPVFIVIAYGIILIVATLTSGYLSYYGLLSTAHEVTLPLVLLLVLVIMTMDATISYFRVSNRSYRYPVAIWFVAAGISIASHFNFLYTNFMREDVERATVSAQVQILRTDLTATRAELSGMESAQFAVKLRTDLDVELDNLGRQIADPLRPGCGTECRMHLANVERILGRQITNLAVPAIGSDKAVVQDWYGRYRAAVDEIFETSLGSTQYPAVARLVRDIDTALLDYDTADRILSTKGGLAALASMRDLSFDIERRANEVLPADRKVEHELIDPTLGRLGEIAYSFQNGFVEMPNPMATFVSLVVGGIVDIFPFVLAFALFGPGKLEPTPGARRGSGGRRIVT
ncbi:hypothetical protein LAZ40_02130 [Cereibacter sphaeroides]|uniref:hypothetical protein n=1 Tax=Cereibacter sphaeroides TaxID=1063 RepID=UPI001F3FDB3D|nr:hypothetical protein [Cereibacter sphaeroides]MCE6957855.1 hypothetical protein [Cereibacter sphaeroides]MCE6971824.1 hypothetical protein [Cereibacter sphaeroides]